MTLRKYCKVFYFWNYVLGIWASDDSNEEDKRVRRSIKKGPRNYSAPVSVVAGGVQQAGQNQNAILNRLFSKYFQYSIYYTIISKYLDAADTLEVENHHSFENIVTSI